MSQRKADLNMNQRLDFVDRDFKIAIINMFEDLKEGRFE